MQSFTETCRTPHTSIHAMIHTVHLVRLVLEVSLLDVSFTITFLLKIITELTHLYPLKIKVI